MEFLEEVKKLSERAVKLKDHLKTKEAVKYSLIMPFLQLLGYNIFDPDELVPEYFIESAVEKTDYAILYNGEPSILIEVKGPEGKWEEHKEKLNKYFNSLGKAKFAILTNGLLYEVFSDVNEDKNMDATPFLTMDLEKLQEPVVNEIKKFHKNDFNIDHIITTPVNLKYSKKTTEYLDKLFNEPHRDFIQLILKNIYTGEVTEEVLARFETVIKDSVLQFIKDIKAPEYEVVEIKEEEVLEEQKEAEVKGEEKAAEEKVAEEKVAEEKAAEEKAAEEKSKEEHDDEEKKPKKRGGLGSFFGI